MSGRRADGPRLSRRGVGASVPPRRITVIGTSGSGKTTMAATIGKRLGLPHIELDALHFTSNWVEVPDEQLRAQAEQATQADGWVTDGNYSAVRDIVWGRADTIVWLDYSLPLILWRLTRRTMRRIFLREELWHGNRESIRTTFFSKDSLYLWVLQTYKKRRREYPLLLNEAEHRHMRVVHLRSPGEAERWVARLG